MSFSRVADIQAEKALFRALKTKSDTPKYGLLYHASVVGQSQPKNKGKMSRVLAAKAVLMARYTRVGARICFFCTCVLWASRFEDATSNACRSYARGIK